MPDAVVMMVLALSAAFVGMFHSLSPGHWLPVVLISKTRKWPTRKALLGALATASGHVTLSLAISVIAIEAGLHLVPHFEESVESYGALVVACFGLGYAINAYYRHHSCHGHSHHGPNPRRAKSPFLFLFLAGFSPCVAALPIFIASSTHGPSGLVVTMTAFALGVVTALSGATILSSAKIIKLDHPFLEHYGDVVTGLAVMLMGLILFFFPH